MTAKEIVTAFNECINNQDSEKLASLMTNNHVFINSVGSSVRGKEAVLKQWKGCFTAFPDYKNHFDKLEQKNDLVVIVGRSTCSNEPMLDGPAIWTAKVVDGKVSEWRVYDDTPENRTKLGA